MGHYPAWPGSQSYLRVACIFNHSTAGGGDTVSSTFTIHDFSNVVYHNGAGRSFVVTGNTATTISVADCRAAGTWVDRGITATAGIPVRTVVTSVSAGCAVASAVAVPGTLTVNKALVPGAVTSPVLVENSLVRAVTDATLAGASPMITSATANFTAADNGVSVSATNIANVAPNIATIVWPAASGASPNTADIANGTITAGVNQNVTIGGTLDGGSAAPQGPITTTRTVNDASSAATNTITSAAARFFASDVGLRVSGTGITSPDCYILTRNSATLVTLASACSTVSAGPNSVTIGQPSRTAPVATDTVQNQGVQLPLNPTLVAGSAPCAADQAAGFGIEGTWLNPGSFVGGAFATQPPGTKAVGEILFTTSVITYGAYVLEIPGGLGIDPLISAYHFNIVYPSVPTGLALCPSTATSPGLGLSIGVNATVVSQAAIPTGVGRPSTAQLRSTRASETGSTSTIFITDDINGAGVNWTGSEFNRICGVPAGPPAINFVCGDG
jgi:hypothetical protein